MPPKPSNDSERKITPEDRDQEREKDKIIEMRDLQDRRYQEQTDQVSKEISLALARIEFNTFHSESLDKALLQGYFSSKFLGGESKEVIDATKTVQEILEDNNEPNNQRSNTKKYVAAAIGVAVIAGLGYGLHELYELLCRKSKDQPTDDVPLPQADKDKISAIYDTWSQQSDEEFWPTFSKLETLNPPATIADHLFFCNYTAQVSPMPDDLWIWQSSDDLMGIVGQLQTLYNQSGSLATLYENITKITYQGQKLPRNVAAEVLTLTLSQILGNLPSF